MTIYSIECKYLHQARSNLKCCANENEVTVLLMNKVTKTSKTNAISQTNTDWVVYSFQRQLPSYVLQSPSRGRLAYFIMQ